MPFSHASSELLIGTGLRRRAPSSKCYRRGSIGGRYLLGQRDAAPQCRLEPTELLVNHRRTPTGHSLDAGEFGVDITGNRARSGCCRPVLYDRLGPVELFVGVEDLDGAIARGECLPRTVEHVGPCAKRCRVVMARIGVQRAVDIDRDW